MINFLSDLSLATVSMRLRQAILSIKLNQPMQKLALMVYPIRGSVEKLISTFQFMGQGVAEIVRSG